MSLAFSGFQRALILLVIALGVVFSIPNFFPESALKDWPAFAPHGQVNLGLDLRGGSYILLEANPADIAAQRLQTKEEEVRIELARSDSGARVDTGDISLQGGKISFTVRN